MAKRKATAAESRHLDRVANLQCGLHYFLGGECNTHLEVHHIREGQGMSQRASNYLTIPLCVEAHRGPQGIHGDRTLWKIAGVSELDVLAWTIQQLSGAT